MSSSSARYIGRPALDYVPDALSGRAAIFDPERYDDGHWIKFDIDALIDMKVME